MAKRNYNKKSEYWDKFGNPNNISIAQESQVFSPELCGDPFYVSDASYVSESRASVSRTSSGGMQTKTRINRAAVSETIDRFSSIRKGMLPYHYASDGVHVRDAIELCQKAYANVAVFRNAIDIMSEFANTDIFLEGGTSKSREFFEDWFKKINIWNLKDQYFREYYRSGNVFLYNNSSLYFVTADANNNDLQSNIINNNTIITILLLFTIITTSYYYYY